MTDSINSIQKACRILSSFSFENSSCSLNDLCKITGFAKTTVHRICNTLVEEGFLNKSDNEIKYSLSTKVFELGSIAIQSLDIKSVAREHMFGMAKKLGETVSLFIESNFSRVCIYTVEGPSEVRVIVPIGEPLPLYLGATGRVLLAFMQDCRREHFIELLRKNPPEKMKKSLDQFTSEIYQAKINGYDVSYGERLTDTVSISAPITYGNNQVAALSISSPSYRHSKEKVQKCIDATLEATRIINNQLR